MARYQCCIQDGNALVLYWIYDIPNWLAATLFTVVFIALNSIGVLFIRPIIRPLVADLSDENNLVGNVLSLYSVMFGLLMGTLAVVTYQNLSTAQQLAENEATTLAALYRDVEYFPEPERTTLLGAIKSYTYFVIHEDWPDQKQGKISTRGNDRVKTIQFPLFSFEPKTMGQQVMQIEALRQFNNLVQARRARISSVQNAIPSILWWTMGSGALVLMALMWLFDSTTRALLVLSGFAAFALGSMIGLIALMDHPFRGELSVSPDPYQIVIDGLMTQ